MYIILIDKDDEGWEILKTDQSDESGDGLAKFKTRASALEHIRKVLPVHHIENIRLARLIDLEIRVEAKDLETE